MYLLNTNTNKVSLTKMQFYPKQGLFSMFVNVADPASRLHGMQGFRVTVFVFRNRFGTECVIVYRVYAFQKAYLSVSIGKQERTQTQTHSTASKQAFVDVKRERVSFTQNRQAN